jgi:hypothetical protein
MLWARAYATLLNNEPGRRDLYHHFCRLSGARSNNNRE